FVLILFLVDKGGKKVGTCGFCEQCHGSRAAAYTGMCGENRKSARRRFFKLKGMQFIELLVVFLGMPSRLN
ncbi:TPA: hypothetical protein ACX6HO_002339, partial [Vibrio cholerae]|uniref:hypothetical protein n=3 Tax=Vibrio cholerae TaxID=666 RepID=UPI00226DA846